MRLVHIFPMLLATITLSCATSGHDRPDEENQRNGTPFLVDIYRDRLDHLSAVRSGECPMHPSCSEFSVQAFEKHGFFVGWILTCDRLMRCGRDEMIWSPLVHVDGVWKHYDPLESNDGWWSNNDTPSPPLSSPGN
jgi:putative component of membrane protein insertase Oxa1/YidC/SpoIIIJ protein YidD